MIPDDFLTRQFPERPILLWLGKDRWELMHDYRMPIGKDCALVPRGFLTDLASVPGPFRSLIDEQALGASAIGHDFLYQNGGVYDTGCDPMTRGQVDRQFYQWMKAERPKVTGWRRTAAYVAVRLAGWLCWRENKQGRTTGMIFDARAILRQVAGFFGGTFAASMAALGPLVVAFRADFAAGEQTVVALVAGAVAALLAWGGTAFRQWRAYARSLLD